MAHDSMRGHFRWVYERATSVAGGLAGSVDEAEGDLRLLAGHLRPRKVPGMRSRNASALVAGSALVVVLLLVGGCSPFSSKGTMPPPGPRGEVDASRAPDFIAVAGRAGGVAGCVPKKYLFPEPTTTVGLQDEPDWPVYAEDLRTLIGHMVPGKGFVPLGVDPAAVPKIPVQQGPAFSAPLGKPASATIYVRSAVAQTAWFAVSAAGGLTGGQGYNNGIGVGCVNVEVGGHLVLVDRPPQDAGVRTLRTIYSRDQAGDLPTLWVNISADGSVSQGEGVPGWWQGEPQGC